MKTINIYITAKHKAELDRLRSKYKVSLSTLIGKLSFAFINSLNKYGDFNKTLEALSNSYLQKDNTYKTSCKPRELNETLANTIKNKNCFASNLVYIYLEKQIKNYVNDKGLTEFYMILDRELQKATDIYWDYNQQIRNTRRMLKQNKEYFKKALESV